MEFNATTYDQLDAIFDEFVELDTPLWVLHGRGGTGKTRRLGRLVKEGKCRIISGAKVTAFQLYRLLYLYRNEPIVIDDIDDLWNDKLCVSLLKQACQTEKEKLVAWQSSRLKLPSTDSSKPSPDDDSGDETCADDQDTTPPTQFYTSSKIMVVTNDWNAGGPNLKALMTRGVNVSFEPSGKEVHREAGAFVRDEEVYDFIGTHAQYVPVNLRDYVLASEHNKTNRLPWRETLLRGWGVTEALTYVYHLETDPKWKNKPTSERIKAFASKQFSQGSSKSRYYELKAKLDLAPIGIG